MTLKFQREEPVLIISELLPLLQLHWEEVGQDRVRMKPNPDLGWYLTAAQGGALLVVTARTGEGVLVGYHVSIGEFHKHYRHIRCAKSDLYWLSPAHRSGWNGLRLFQAVEVELKRHGVQVWYEAHKLAPGLDHSKLFHHLGFHPVELIHSKWLGDEIQPSLFKED